MENVKVMSLDNSGNQRLSFETKLSDINLNWLGQTPNGKNYRIGNILINNVVTSCRVPIATLEKNPSLTIGDMVVVVATKLESITALQVIGTPKNLGTTAGSDIFDDIFATTERLVEEVEEA